MSERCVQYLSSINMAAEGDLASLENLSRILIGASLMDLLDQIGTSSDELITLREAARQGPYTMQYLALRCKQGEFPAVRSGGRWLTSRRALQLYLGEVGKRRAHRLVKR